MSNGERETIYLDNAASSCPKPPEVAVAVSDCVRRLCANPGRGAHRLAVEAARVIHRTRRLAAKLLGAGRSEDVIFTQNATDALNLVLHSMLAPGDHVVTTVAEHNAVVRPLKSLAATGVEVTPVAVDGAGRVDPEEIVRAVCGSTRLVVMAHVSNVTGAVQPLADIALRLAEREVPLLVDAAQSAGAMPLDSALPGTVIIACTGHKSLLGPQGTGLLCLPPEVELKTVRQGGTGSHSEESDQEALARPDRYESGTLNTPGIAGLGAGMEFLLAKGIDEVARHKQELVHRLLAGLAETAGVTVYGPPPGEERGHLVSFNVQGLAPAAVAAALEREHGIASRAGLHCAPGAHAAMGSGVGGAVRLSVGYFNTGEEVDAAVAAVGEIAARARE